ncbi:MAG TPA: hypothetical protein VLZ06_02950 [Solirubrobacteraceae bacterium]|nr:hypothetical protein [Solirubrobacteraceae bacterium]
MRIRGVLLAALAVAAIALVPASGASASNASATHAYLSANYALVHAAHTRIHQVESTLRGLLAQIRRECPLAAKGSPEETQSEQLSNEVIGTMVLTAIRLDLPAGRAYVKAVRPLRWSSPSLTRSVHGYAEKVAKIITLPVPKLCQDVKSWASSGFTTLPSATRPFDSVFLNSWVSPGFLPSALKPYEGGSVRSLVRQTEKQESDIVDLEAREVETWGKIMDSLELEP